MKIRKFVKEICKILKELVKKGKTPAVFALRLEIDRLLTEGFNDNEWNTYFNLQKNIGKSVVSLAEESGNRLNTLTNQVKRNPNPEKTKRKKIWYDSLQTPTEHSSNYLFTTPVNRRLSIAPVIIEDYSTSITSIPFNSEIQDSPYLAKEVLERLKISSAELKNEELKNPTLVGNLCIQEKMRTIQEGILHGIIPIENEVGAVHSCLLLDTEFPLEYSTIFTKSEYNSFRTSEYELNKINGVGFRCKDIDENDPESCSLGKCLDALDTYCTTMSPEPKGEADFTGNDTKKDTSTLKRPDFQVCTTDNRIWTIVASELKSPWAKECKKKKDTSQAIKNCIEAFQAEIERFPNYTNPKLAVVVDVFVAVTTGSLGIVAKLNDMCLEITCLAVREWLGLQIKIHELAGPQISLLEKSKTVKGWMLPFSPEVCSSVVAEEAERETIVENQQRKSKVSGRKKII
ncbi:hypothetical protein HK096_005018 [Nowakowskiella sp. JEL0078]|nr:hypothetical protein HK096_005018 [Nowakowskiella sp. JEL0078]